MMKFVYRTLLVVSMLLISQLAIGQNCQWIFPDSYNNVNKTGLKIQYVKFYSNATVIEFQYDNHYNQSGWVQLSDACEIKAYPSGRTYKLVSASGIPYAPNKHNFKSINDKLTFTCVFPAVPDGTYSLDWIEEGDWIITSIRSQSGSLVDNSKGVRLATQPSNFSTSSASASYGTFSSGTNRREPKTVTVGRSVSTAYHNWTLKSINLTSSKTVCNWSVTPTQNNTVIYMTQGVYLIDNKGKKYDMISCDGISMSPKQDVIYNVRTVDFTVTFPAIDEDASSVTYYSSPTFQVNGINVSSGRAYHAPANSNKNYGDAYSVNNVVTFKAYASNSSSPKANGRWSDFGAWKNCDFTIEYDPNKRSVVFNMAHKQRYEVLSYEKTDPSILTLYCRDVTSGEKCEIEFVTLSEEAGTQIYLTFSDKRICYAVIESAGSLTAIPQTSTSSQDYPSRVLPETISYPSCSKAYTNSGMTLTKVTSNSYQTVMEFEYTYSQDQDGGVWLSPNTCIKAYPSGTKYKMISAEGIETSSVQPDGHHYKGEKTRFKVFFPAMPANTTHFDFMEEDAMSDWVLCGISDSPQYRHDFLMLNSSDASQSVEWEWYGGEKTFIVATTAYDYDIVGLPAWCEVKAKVAEGFKIKCNSDGKAELSDYFIVKANGMEIRVNVKCKKYYEYSSPQATISNVDVSHWSYSKKISVTPTIAVKNMSGKKISLWAYLFDRNGDVVNDPLASMKETTPDSDTYTLSSASLVIDYSALGISDLTGYTVAIALYDNENAVHFAVSDGVNVIRKNRSDIASAIQEWGKCRLVAITENSGDIAINGGNGYRSLGLPSEMLDDIEEIRDMKERIQDISLTERGEYVIIYADNGVKLSNNIPQGMYDALKDMNEKAEKITSAVFNDDGDWIVVSEKSFIASSSELQNEMKEGISQFGAIYSACFTSDGYIIVYERGYKSSGYIPSTLKTAISTTTINYYRIKVSGDSWFFADKEGNYQMSL